MTTLQDRPHTALLVIDVQNDVVAQAFQGDLPTKDVPFGQWDQ